MQLISKKTLKPKLQNLELVKNSNEKMENKPKNQSPAKFKNIFV